MTKDEQQELIINEIEKNEFNCLLYLATGSGKSRILIEAIKRLKPKSVLWTCATEKFRAQGLEEEFNKWGGDFSIVTPICWHSLGSCKQNYDLLVMDEIQMVTKKRVNYLKSHKPNKIIACSGTKPRDLAKQLMINSLNIPEIVNIGVDEAVKKDLIADYEVEVRYCELDNINKVMIKPGFYSTEKETYQWYCRKIDKLKDEGRWLDVKKMSLNRARFIYNCKSKLTAGLEIVKEFKDKRTIIFSKSSIAADSLSPNRFHTVMDKKVAKETYNKFNNLEINHISVIDAANTSLNFNEIELVFVYQLDSNPTNYLQRQGRSLRKRENYKAKIIILCLKNTQDEIWVNECIKSLKNVS